MEKIDLAHFESIFIQKCLTDEEYFSKVSEITNPIYIENIHRRRIFELVHSFFTKRNTLPNLVEIKTYLTTKELKESYVAVVNELQEKTNLNYNKEELYANTERFLKEKSIYHTMLDVADEITNGNINTSDILDRFEKNCNICLEVDSGLDVFSDVDKIVKDLSVTQPTITSGWKWLDDKLGGGFLQDGKAMYVFAGQTNVGKSIILGNIAQNIAQNKKTVLLVSLEMSEMMYAKRMCSSITKIPIRNLRDESSTMKGIMDDLHSKNPKGTVLIKEFPPSTITNKQLEVYIKSLQNRGIKIDAIIIDYINLLTTNFGNNSYERIKHLAEKVRAMSYIFKCPVITATQLGRSGFNTEEPDLTTISESIGLAATADFMCSAYQLGEDKDMGILRMGMMKNRFGANFGSSAFSIEYQTLSISENDELNSMTEEAEDARNTLHELAS
jgi:replicative DNA helicase